ncbi:hypothetical protein CCAX7_39920 [Capsulimonas corticalis]|uniref:Ice-binding protein C-terminal domain-containing protein n=2 Tax=Capsulimonas corticalis TaxID=2219043 RepID=A0A402D527_9BACT|nr:hypothetical protein CCAX7_39920 [Capsulimonas corticalis]
MINLNDMKKWSASIAAGAFTVAAFGFAQPVQAASWNAANDFSKTANPNSVWSYAGSNSGVFTYESTEGSGLDAWHAGPGSLPYVAHNGATTTNYSYGTVAVPANGITMHPGADGEKSEVIFTAPTAGHYKVNASFFGESLPGYPATSTDVHVNVNGSTALFNNFVSAYGVGPSYSNSYLLLNAGDKLEFTVGYGPNGNYLYDSTGFNASISAVPEPSAFAAFGVGLAVLGACFYRRRQVIA